MKTFTSAMLAMEANPALTTSDGSLNYMPIFKIIIALYLLYVAALGKGKILENKFLKIDEKKYRLYIRLAALAGAVFMVADSIIEFFFYDNSALVTVSNICWVLGLVALVGMLVINIVTTDRKAAMEEQRKQDEIAIQKQKDKLRAAFVFDDEEEKSESDTEKGEDKAE